MFMITQRLVAPLQTHVAELLVSFCPLLGYLQAALGDV
jgi:hypothetical protein